jgi:hypothetical protein
MIYFLKGSLPWQGLNAKTREEKYRLITEKKKSCRAEDLCSDLPVEFLNYLTYVKSLGFKNDPDYRKLRRSFKELFMKNEFIYDYEFDWKPGNPDCELQDQIIELEEEEKEEKIINTDENPEEGINENRFDEDKESQRDPEQVKLEEAVEEYLKRGTEINEEKNGKKCNVF